MLAEGCGPTGGKPLQRLGRRHWLPPRRPRSARCRPRQLEPVLAETPPRLDPKRSQLLDRLRDAGMHAGVQLEHGRKARLEALAVEHSVGHRRRLERLGVEDEELLLEPTENGDDSPKRCGTIAASLERGVGRIGTSPIAGVRWSFRDKDVGAFRPEATNATGTQLRASSAARRHRLRLAGLPGRGVVGGPGRQCGPDRSGPGEGPRAR